MSFSTLGLLPALVSGCESLGYTTPTPIQNEAIPIILDGSDLIGCADTGTGKTAAFLLPLIQKLTAMPGAGIQALILAPTREVASQIHAALESLDPQKVARAAVIVGGVSMERQRDALKRRPRVVVATPGRLLDHIERGTISLSYVQFLVLDEADRMLDMGFWPSIQKILSKIPSKRQTLLFSATMSRAIEEIARSTMNQPKMVEVSPRGQAAPLVDQTVYPVALTSKTALLIDLLEQKQLERVLVFTRTRRGAERLSHLLFRSRC
ncbi:MAG: DEAD/DEAH box helicase [Pyrinomonadaceae bacterium]